MDERMATRNTRQSLRAYRPLRHFASTLTRQQCHKEEIEMATPTNDELDKLLNWCEESEDIGTHYPGATYEQGVYAALSWVFGPGKNPAEIKGD